MPQTDPIAGLSQPQILALNAIAAGSSIADAAALAGVHRCTIHTWSRENKTFRAALGENKRLHAEMVGEQYRGLADAAVAALRDILENPKTAAGVRLKAALAVLNAVTAAAPAAEPETQPAAPEQSVQTPEPAPLEVQMAEFLDVPTTPDLADDPITSCNCGSGKKAWRCCGIDGIGPRYSRAA